MNGGNGGTDKRPTSEKARRAAWSAVALVALAAVLVLVLLPAPVAAADSKPVVTLSKEEAGKGGEITVTGSGWRPNALLMLLICGRSAPGRGVIGGTNSCANADGRAVTTDATGRFSKRLPVAEPPEPCPCVVHVATVTGEQAAVDAEFTVAGHPVAPLPSQASAARLSVLAAARLEGDDGILVWFGAPASRKLVVTVGNLGPAPVKDPVFQVGTSHGVFAPSWQEQQWRGTIPPGQKARVELNVQLASGAHGDYLVSMKYGGKVLAAQPWGVGRPWGVTLFWILLCLVVPAAVFRIGMAVVDRVRPRSGGTAGGAGRHRTVRLRRTAAKPPKAPTQAPTAATAPTAALPWFTPDSAPSENHPTTKGQS
ncbi:hypothetical protein [Streptomyces sp. SYSU K217416]